MSYNRERSGGGGGGSNSNYNRNGPHGRTNINNDRGYNGNDNGSYRGGNERDRGYEDRSGYGNRPGGNDGYGRNPGYNGSSGRSGYGSGPPHRGGYDGGNTSGGGHGNRGYDGGAPPGSNGASRSGYGGPSSSYDDRGYGGSGSVPGSYSRSGLTGRGYGRGPGDSEGYGPPEQRGGYGGPPPSGRGNGPSAYRGAGSRGRSRERPSGSDGRGAPGGGRSRSRERGTSSIGYQRTSGGGSSGYGHPGDRGYGGNSDRDRGYGGSGYGGGSGGRGEYPGSSRGGGGRGFGGPGRGRGGRGGGGPPLQTGEGCGNVTGSGYESMGNPITDPNELSIWEAKTSLNEVSEDIMSNVENYQICTRPNYADIGEPVKVKANYFKLTLDKNLKQLYKYHIDINQVYDKKNDKYGGSIASPFDGDHSKTPQEDKDKKMETETRKDRKPLPKARLRTIINSVIAQNPRYFDGHNTVHDGVANIYSLNLLDKKKDELIFENVIPENLSNPPKADGKDNDKKRTYRGARFNVTLKLVENINLDNLRNFFTDPTLPTPLATIQALDVAMRHLASQRLINVGRNFFSMKNTKELTISKDLTWGYHQSIRPTNNQLLLNVDVTATVFYTACNLVEFCASELSGSAGGRGGGRGGVTARDLEKSGFNKIDIRKISRTTKNLEIEVSHRPGAKKQKIIGISEFPLRDEKFKDKDGKDVYVCDYFESRYNIRLKCLNLPCIMTGSRKRPNLIPMEVCRLAPGQKCPNISDTDTAAIIKQTNTNPSIRAQHISGQLQQCNFENDKYVSNFGLSIQSEMVQLNARVLKTPNVQYSNVSEIPYQGVWNMRNKRFIQGATLTKWGVVDFANVAPFQLDRFIDGLCNMASSSNMIIENSRPVIVRSNDYRGQSYEAVMQDAVRLINKNDHKNDTLPVQLLLVIKPDASSAPYGDIKRASDSILGIPSQCIVAKNVLKVSPQYCANVCLKLNMKLGGKNSYIQDNIPIVYDEPTMIIGADINHPRAGTNRLAPSIASVVTSLDKYVSKHVARVSAQQSSRSETIQELPNMLCDLFMEYYQHTNRKPSKIIYYRGGISEGQFQDILNTEMRALRIACAKMSADFHPPVTFIIVNRRHHTRCFPLDRSGTDKSGNIVPGTVIDSAITSPHLHDFYLYGHSGIQGTSCPAHYTVIYDENNINANDMQKMTYNLCYTYARCTRSVSIVPQVYYANLAAARARYFLTDNSDTISASSHGSANGSGIGSSFDFSKLHERLHSCMFFI